MSHPAPPPTDEPSTAPEPDMSVTVIGGYLGSGKTTLVNHLLSAGTERIAVLVNDFGDINIDAALIEQEDGQTIALANGCICCSLVDGLAAALDTITGFVPRPDRLVIEASGVADPASVAAYGHGPGLSLDAVVVLVDAETVMGQARDKYVGDTVTGQLRSADIVVINKVDLVERAAVEALRGWLETRVDRALVVEASQAEVDPAVLFGRLAQSTGSPSWAVVDGQPIHDRADDVFQSWSWVGRVPVPRSAIEDLMVELPESIIRAKGVVWLVDQPDRPQVLQRIGSRWSLGPLPGGSAVTTPAGSQLVLIGTKGAVDETWLSDRLDN